MYIDHYKAIRAHPLLRASTICYIFENNLGHEHDHAASLINRLSLFDNVAILLEDPAVVGFHTTPQSRLKADDRLHELVAHKALAFAPEIISINHDASVCGEHARDMLIEQMENMCEYTRRRPNGDGVRIVSSTFDENNVEMENRHDDLQRALSLLVYAANMFVARRLPVNYAAIRAKQGARILDTEIAAARAMFLPPVPPRLVHTAPPLPEQPAKRRRLDPDAYRDPPPLDF